MTKLKFNIYYPHNLYFLMDNLSGWDVHCRSFLKEEFPDLFLSIKRLLPAYRKIRRKYGWETESIERFFLESEMKRVVKNLAKISIKEQKIILKIVDILDKKLKPLWLKKEKVLKCRIEDLNKHWKQYSNQAVKEIERFLDLKIPKKTEVFILFTPRGTGGGANLGKKGFTLEAGDPRTPSIISFEVLLHELIHFTEIVNNKETEKELRKYRLRRQGSFSESLLIKEAIVNLLCPHGFLSEKLKIGKFFIPQSAKNNYEAELFKKQILLKELVLEYFKSKKHRDYRNDFLPKIASVIKKYRD